MVWLPDGVKILKICLFVLTEFTNMTDRQMERYRQQGSWDAPEQRWIIFIDVCCEHANL